MDAIIYYAIGGVVAVYIGYFAIAYASQVILAIAPFLAGLAIYNMGSMYPSVVGFALNYGLEIPAELTDTVVIVNTTVIILITLVITLPILPFHFMKDL